MNNCEGSRKNHGGIYPFIGCHDYIQETTKKGLKMLKFNCNVITYVIGNFETLQEASEMYHEGLCIQYLDVTLRAFFMLGSSAY